MTPIKIKDVKKGDRIIERAYGVSMEYDVLEDSKIIRRETTDGYMVPVKVVYRGTPAETMELFESLECEIKCPQYGLKLYKIEE